MAKPHKLIDGRAVAEKVFAELRGEIALLKASGTTPGLAVVLVGDDPASRAYVRSKDKMCRELGLHSVKLELPANTTEADLLERVEESSTGVSLRDAKVVVGGGRGVGSAEGFAIIDKALDIADQAVQG